jgi:peptidoglycan hydrolase-like protein with peptidoglycan-binding domain
MGEINVTAKQCTSVGGTFDTSTGELKGVELAEMVMVKASGGNLSNRDIADLQRELARSRSLGTMPERLGQAATSSSTKPPEAYTQSGTYSVAQSDSDLREGFKGDRVSSLQQKLKDLGYDLGGTGSKSDGVDGFWGPKTQKAYEQYRRDAEGQDSPSIRQRDVNRSRYTTLSAGETASDLSRQMTEKTSDGHARPDTDAITKTMSGLSNAQMRDVNAAMVRKTGKDLPTTINEMDSGPWVDHESVAIAGNNEDYRDLMSKMAKGHRNEGLWASATSPVVDDYAKHLVDARHTSGLGWLPTSLGGSDTSKINDVFATASGAQLRELDDRFRKGVNGVRYDNGLRGYIENEVGEGSHRDALLAQLDRPLR